MKKVRFDEEDEGIDVTPLIDIVFQLIIFFMVVGKMVVEETAMKIEIPLSTMADIQVEPDKLGRLVINLNKEGQIMISRNGPHNITQASYILKKVADGFRKKNKLKKDDLIDQAVLLRVDRKAEWENVKRILDTCLEFKYWNTKWVANNPKD